MAAAIVALRQLAALYGVQTAYNDVARRRCVASADSLLYALRALGVELQDPHDAPTAIRAYHQTWWRRVCEPVVVVWDGKPGSLTLRLPRQQDGPLACRLQGENEEIQEWSVMIETLPVQRTADVEGMPYVERRLALPDAVPLGQHRLQLAIAGVTAETLVLRAPRQAVRPEHRTWGVFLPLYALHSQQSWGGGNFTDLQQLSEWVSELGGSVVATLPLLTAFLDEPFDPSPYAPVSRLFWNELYIDVTRAPELPQSPEAQALLASTAVQEEIAALRAAPLVDYRRQMALQRRLLEVLARAFFGASTPRRTEFAQFVQSHPQVEDYARFRAIGERLCTPWSQWPQPWRDGVLCDRDVETDVVRYHLYVQWLAHEQIQELAAQARERGPGLYLDLPLGVHRHGYDVWRERTAFALAASGGAPPDAVFTKGQDWGFPPLHPQHNREQGYRYMTAYVRHHLRRAGMLRLDHVMALHRLFWIPVGLEPREGVYVRYPAEELYALLTLESHRHNAMLVGENLGTVPTVVNRALARHRIHRMHVLQYELPAQAAQTPRPPHADTVASVNTHDMPMFSAFWQGLDLHDRLAAGLLDATGLQHEQRALDTLKHTLVALLRQAGWLPQDTTEMQAVIAACLMHLAASPSRVVLINVEDLWLESEPQNVPGAGDTRPNWQRKARERFELWRQRAEVINVLRDVNRLRHRA